MRKINRPQNDDRRKLTLEHEEQIKKRWIDSNGTLNRAAIAREYGVHRSRIAQIIKSIL